jgi:hypothetical protein
MIIPVSFTIDFNGNDCIELRGILLKRLKYEKLVGGFGTVVKCFHPFFQLILLLVLAMLTMTHGGGKGGTKQ